MPTSGLKAACLYSSLLVAKINSENNLLDFASYTNDLWELLKNLM